MRNIALPILTFLVLTIWSVDTYSKGKDDDFKRAFNAATGYIYDENYIDALKYLMKCDSLQPENANIQFQIGLCYHNSRTEGAKAIQYFQNATKMVSPEYKDGYYKEIYAPIDAWMFLADDLHKYYKFDEAIEAYNKYRSYFEDADVEIDKVVQRKIKICENAKKLVASEIGLRIENLGDSINSKYADYKPLITADESMLFFTSRREGSTGGELDETGKYYEDIYVAEKINGTWSSPKGIGAPINSTDHEATAGLSADGQQLFIYRFVEGTGDIFVSNLNGENWGIPKKVGSDINSAAWEPYASIGPNSDILFFTSDREGGYGGRDIYYSRKMPTGEWGLAVNMGPGINTPYNEDGPFLHPDGKTLYFSSEGHNSMGGFDIFYVEKQEDESWSKPTNMGYPANTTGDDVFFTPTADGKSAFYSSFREDGFGEQDIYKMTFEQVQEKSLAIYKGVIKMRDGAIPEDVFIMVADANTGEIVGEYKPNSASGKYLIVLPAGRDYEVSYEGSACYYKTDYISVPANAQYHIVENAINLNPLEVGEVVNLDHIYYEYASANLKDSSKVQLDGLVKLLKKCPNITIEISGHTDSKGAEDYNLKLSQDRAQSVVNYLIEKGIKESRLVAKGYGESQPIAPNENEDGSDNPAGRELNRRTEMKVTGV